MSDKDAIIRRGQAADRMLKDENVMSALGEIEAELVTAWAQTGPNQADAREDMYRMVKALELFQSKLETWRDNGRVESEKILRHTAVQVET